MTDIEVDGLTFSFPAGWQVSRYDEWVYYRKQFSRMKNGIKAVDLVAVDPQGVGWLIEVKDYRQHPRTKPSELADEVWHKVFDTLAALPPAKNCANDAHEQRMAAALLNAKKYRVAVQLEQPDKPSKLRPRPINPADVKQKLRQLLKPIAPHSLVVEQANMGTVGWYVT
jgi:hypothetical protein